MPALTPSHMIPPRGSLWLWRGNSYDVVAVIGTTIHLSEIGSEHRFYQTAQFGVWNDPVAM